MQRHPFITHADARVSRAYRIFRTMGLRHLYVTPDRPLVVGVMTRKDVIQENTSLTLGEKAERIMAERRQSGGNYVDGEAEGADAFPGGANLYSQDYADRFKSKKNEPSTLGVGASMWTEEKQAPTTGMINSAMTTITTTRTTTKTNVCLTFRITKVMPAKMTMVTMMTAL